MNGKCARVEALSPRPEGQYRFAVRMRAAEPMAVTIEALGAWSVFDISTDWGEYEILIAEPAGNYIDLYPLADTTLYVEDMQLTYGREAYDWRPAPEDDVTYDWTCVSLDEATIASIRDITNQIEYFQLTAGTQQPAKPTTYPPPSPWSVSETFDGAYQTTVRTTGSITDALVDAATFAHATDGAAGIYEFVYDGTSWRYDGTAVNLADFGITVSGSVTAGDTVDVTLRMNMGMIMYRCVVTLYSDGTFSWGDVTPSATFDAVKSAMNTSTKYQTQVQQLLGSWDARVQAATVNEETGETIQDMVGRIGLTEAAVTTLVDEVRNSDDGLSKRITSLQTQTSKDILNTFNEATKYADDQYGETKEYVVTAQSWQRFSADGIEQGKLGSPFKSKLTNEELGFYENDHRVAYINNNRLMIMNGEILNSLIIGNFEFVSGDNGLGIIFNGSWGGA